MTSTISWPLASTVKETDSDLKPLVNKISSVFTPAEILVYQNLWRLADQHGVGHISGPSAALFLERSGLPNTLLYEIWRLSDKQNLGYLRFQEFCMCCRLVAHAQQGKAVNREGMLQEPPMMPQFDLSGILTYRGSNVSSHGSSAVFTSPDVLTSKASGGSGSPELKRSSFSNANNDNTHHIPSSYSVNPNDLKKYKSIYYNLTLDSSGLLLGDEAKKIMLRSGLPSAALSRIWTLVDRDHDGRLNEMEFVIAMHLISICRYGVSVPTSLPQELLELLRELPKKDTINNKVPHVDQKTFQENPSCMNFDERRYESDLKSAVKSELKESGNKTALHESDGEFSEVLTSLCKIERNLLHEVLQSLDLYSQKLDDLRDVKESLKFKLVTNTNALKEKLIRCMEFKNEVHKRKIELDELLEKLRQVQQQTRYTELDIDHYQNDIVFLHRLIDMTKKDIQQVESRKTVLTRITDSTEAQTRLLDENFKQITQRVELEKNLLEKQQEEIRYLKNSFNKLRQDKEEAESKDSVLQEKLRKALLDRDFLLQRRNTEASVLLKLERLRLHTEEEKAKLKEKQYSILNMPLQTMGDLSRCSPTITQSAYPLKTSLPRDKKGVPVRAVVEPTNLSQHSLVKAQDSLEWSSVMGTHCGALFYDRTKCFMDVKCSEKGARDLRQSEHVPNTIHTSHEAISGSCLLKEGLVDDKLQVNLTDALLSNSQHQQKDRMFSTPLTVHAIRDSKDEVQEFLGSSTTNQEQPNLFSSAIQTRFDQSLPDSPKREMKCISESECVKTIS